MESLFSGTICIFVLILLSPASVSSNNHTTEFHLCNGAPNPALKIVCSQLDKWDSAVRSSFQATWSSWSSSTVWSDSRSRWSQTASSWTVWSAWSTYSDINQHGQTQSLPRQRLPDPLPANNEAGQEWSDSATAINSQTTVQDNLQHYQPTGAQVETDYVITSRVSPGGEGYEGETEITQGMQPQSANANTVYEQKKDQELVQVIDTAPQAPSEAAYSVNIWNDGDAQFDSVDEDFSRNPSQQIENIGGQQRDAFPSRHSLSSNIRLQQDNRPMQHFVAPDRSTTTISRTSTFSSSRTQQQQQHTAVQSVTHSVPANRPRNNFVPQVQGGSARKFEKDLFSMNQDTVGPPGFQSSTDRQRNLQTALPSTVAGPPGVRPAEMVQTRPREFGSGRQLISASGQQSAFSGAQRPSSGFEFGSQAMPMQRRQQLNGGGDVDRRWEGQRRENIGGTGSQRRQFMKSIDGQNFRTQERQSLAQPSEFQQRFGGQRMDGARIPPPPSQSAPNWHQQGHISNQPIFRGNQSFVNGWQQGQRPFPPASQIPQPRDVQFPHRPDGFGGAQKKPIDRTQERQSLAQPSEFQQRFGGQRMDGARIPPPPSQSAPNWHQQGHISNQPIFRGNQSFVNGWQQGQRPFPPASQIPQPRDVQFPHRPDGFGGAQKKPIDRTQERQSLAQPSEFQQRFGGQRMDGARIPPPPSQSAPNWHQQGHISNQPIFRGNQSFVNGWQQGQRPFPPASQIPQPRDVQFPHRPDGFGGAQKKPIDRNQRMGEFFQKNASNPYECMDVLCLCPFVRGRRVGTDCRLRSGERLGLAIRKEYRQLTPRERNNLHMALNVLKKSGEYDRIAEWHSSPESSGGAHSGPAFLPWHREYIKRFEIALRLVDHTVALPYWDSTVDGRIPDPAETSLFSAELMGDVDNRGNVVTGFAAWWNPPDGHTHLKRHPGFQGRPLNEADISAVMQRDDVSSVMAYTAPRQGCEHQTDWTCLEYSHGNVLIWVGGEMFQQITSANDPLFFFHHAFVDRIWEDWRQLKQSAMARTLAYPPDLPHCSSEDHFARSPMRPFAPLRNIDGVADRYTTYLYKYAPRPSCSRGRDEQCGSEFLFCDLSHGPPQCAAKIRRGGKCWGFVNGERPCLHGECRENICVIIGQEAFDIRNKRDTNNVINDEPDSTTDEESCFNSHECCAVWSNNAQCESNALIMSEWCKASCAKCHPKYDLRNECSDRHQLCVYWAEEGECQSNSLWMLENCRNSCGQCDTKRDHICPPSPIVNNDTRNDITL
ncbi:Putative tyrosinase-like protein tyr-3 [Toxocara canis]|uniref:Putative tyrosinase-like protein tyr-3 n=1 Tax=Toxocara canis TaxID=6265 RepID=A0A0B2V5S1_TOXCA|nr:Putative tyrosinase-like protein tyr-3 [Toxocara canis]